MYNNKAGIVIFWILLLLTLQQSVLWAQGRVWRVPQEKPKIQEAIDACRFNSEDVVRVSDGTYTGDINFNGKDITVYSVNGASSTIITGTGTGSVVTFNSGEGRDSVLRGFTVTGGDATYGGGIFCDGSSPTLTVNIIISNDATHGGGICCFDQSSPSIEDNVIGTYYEGNSAVGYGGGIYCYGASNPDIKYNTIIDNDAGFGGGICCHSSSPNIIGNGNSAYGGQITNNSADYGGGICCVENSAPNIKTSNNISSNRAYIAGGGIYCSDNIYLSPQIWNNSITSNEVGLVGSFNGIGGGICCANSSPSIRYNIISQNEAYGLEYSEGGGIWCSNSTALIAKNDISVNKANYYGYGGGIFCSSAVTITTNHIRVNSAGLFGGGIYCESSALIVNNLFENNCTIGTGSRGAGLLIATSSNPDVTNNTIVYNKAQGGSTAGGGIYCEEDSAPVITNCILWGNLASAPGTVQDEIDKNATANPIVTYCCIQYGYPGAGNISTNPLFLIESPMF